MEKKPRTHFFHVPKCNKVNHPAKKICKEFGKLAWDNSLIFGSAIAISSQVPPFALVIGIDRVVIEKCHLKAIFKSKNKMIFLQ